MSTQRTVNIPGEVAMAASELPEPQQQYFWAEVASRAKSVPIAYLCWFLFGIHYLYLGKILTQIIFWLTLGGVGIWAIVDLARIPGVVNGYNASVARRVLETAQAMAFQAEGRTGHSAGQEG